MITEFGKQLRKYRIDKTITLREMADSLRISPAYLSAVETGKREITDTIFDSIVTFFSLIGNDIDNLKHLADISRKELSINLKEASADQRNSAAFFARRLNELTPEELEKINKVLEEN